MKKLDKYQKMDIRGGAAAFSSVSALMSVVAVFQTVCTVTELIMNWTIDTEPSKIADFKSWSRRPRYTEYGEEKFTFRNTLNSSLAVVLS